MGFLTTFTIYNDCCHNINKDPEGFAQAIYDNCSNFKGERHGIAGNCNVIGQKTRHADDHTIYVHMGNCVTEVNPYSEDFKKLAERSPEFADSLVRFLESELKELKKYKITHNKKKSQ